MLGAHQICFQDLVCIMRTRGMLESPLSVFMFYVSEVVQGKECCKFQFVARLLLQVADSC